MVVLLPLILAGAGLVMNTIGSLKSGKAAKKAADSAAEREEQNAAYAELQAEDAVARGREQESRFRSSVRSLIGTQRAGFAGQGVKVDRGSALDVQADTAYLGELDALTIRNNAAREAWGYQVEATDRRRGAEITRRSGAAAQSASRWGAASTVLTGASMLLDRYGWSSKGGAK